MLSFFNGVSEELKKLQKPSKKEVYITTITVIVTITIFSLVILLADFVISKLLGFIF